MAKFISAKEAAELIPDGARIMFGGFMGCGSAHDTIREIAKKGTKDLTTISNDASMPNGPDGDDYYAMAKLVHNKQIKKMIVTHVGLNPEVAEQMNAGTLELELVPQGTLAERIRSGGAGLGGVLTPTGVGTLVAEGKKIIEVDGKEYLFEKPLTADFAIFSGFKVDKAGNVWYKGTARGFNPAMATAADVVIVEADNLVEIGDIEPENVMTPGVFIDYVVVTGGAE